MLKKLSMFLGFILLVSLISCYYLINAHLKQPLNLNSEQLLTIKKGTSLNSFSQTLVTKGWIDTNVWLKIVAKLNVNLSAIKVGTYLVEPGTSVIELLEQIVEGKEHQFSITFIEGSTFKDWLQVLSLHPQVSHHLNTDKFTDIPVKLELDFVHPEGLFFPDTYAFTFGTTDIEILQRAYHKMEKELNEQWQNRALDLPYDSVYQALIMASIIEKESGYVAEQEIISSVFINRLNKKMRLQTDPTVIYGLGERYQGDIKRSHLREKTAYNTYRINGLPPTPIAMPGTLAIKAALNPALTDYYYFVSDGKGQHVFSTTLAEHNQAVAIYLKEMRTRLKNEKSNNEK
ncbi:MAG: UPF0755 protein [Alteromonadaceae bacterium]|jgi:UPF0755 protein